MPQLLDIDKLFDELAQWADWEVSQGLRGVPIDEADQEDLRDIHRHWRECIRCPLAAHRTRMVFGEGASDARIVFVGEGPGAAEDKSGRPFVGPAGKLLTKMIAAMGFAREEVYICNVVKCRPPKNRKPNADELASCVPLLREQLSVIGPEVIVALGATAARALLSTERPIGQLRGQWFSYEGVPVMPTFHPAYLLRQEREKGKAWADLQDVLRHLGLPIPEHSRKAPRHS